MNSNKSHDDSDQFRPTTSGPDKMAKVRQEREREEEIERVLYLTT